MDPSDPPRIASYRLTGRIGDGAHGVVYAAETGSGARVAVKLLYRRLSEDEGVRRAFGAELRRAQRVPGVHVARVLSYGIHDGRLYHAVEYVEGPSLAEVVERYGPRDGAELERLAIITLSALADVHEAGTAHGGFGPGSVLMGPDGPRVIDVGVGRALDTVRPAGVVPSPAAAFTAPERLAGAPLGPEADMFSWACTLVYAATGRPPFDAGVMSGVADRVLNGPPDLSMLRGALPEAVLACLNKIPARRPTTRDLLPRLHAPHPAPPGIPPTSTIPFSETAFPTTTPTSAFPTSTFPGTSPIPGATAFPGAGGTAVWGHLPATPRNNTPHPPHPPLPQNAAGPNTAPPNTASSNVTPFNVTSAHVTPLDVTSAHEGSVPSHPGTSRPPLRVITGTTPATSPTPLGGVPREHPQGQGDILGPTTAPGGDRAAGPGVSPAVETGVPATQGGVPGLRGDFPGAQTSVPGAGNGVPGPQAGAPTVGADVPGAGAARAGRKGAAASRHALPSAPGEAAGSAPAATGGRGGGRGRRRRRVLGVAAVLAGGLALAAVVAVILAPGRPTGLEVPGAFGPPPTLMPGPSAGDPSATDPTPVPSPPEPSPTPTPSPTPPHSKPPAPKPVLLVSPTRYRVTSDYIVYVNIRLRAPDGAVRWRATMSDGGVLSSTHGTIRAGRSATITAYGTPYCSTSRIRFTSDGGSKTVTITWGGTRC
ncbi:hypothetical protein Skr01_60810 [Sphaerisporangium krabiense]|nr:hypothetical protein Skr01_60810 [Sphaerisporangium krabiense]